MLDVVSRWRADLSQLLHAYEQRRGPLGAFLLRLYAFFVVLNAGCYWLGILVAYPEKIFGYDNTHYFFLQIPVGCLGALFDTLSFFVTVAVVRRALRTTSAFHYVAHLGVDLLLAILATFWVLFVFSASGWIMSHVEAQPELLTDRNALYERRLSDALRHPRANWRNLYFGLVMGISAALPTLLHMGLFVRALWRELSPRTAR